jgi:hypothetical protein
LPHNAACCCTLCSIGISSGIVLSHEILYL